MDKIMYKVLVILIVIFLIFCVTPHIHSKRIERAFYEPSLHEINVIVKELKENVVQLNNKLDDISISLTLNPFITKCVDLIKSKNSIGSTKCWKKIQTFVQNYSTNKSNEILNETLETIIIDSYNGDMTSILIIAKFIGQNNLPKSNLTTHGYKILLNEMKDYGGLYTKEIKTIGGGGIESLTYRVIKYILDTEGQDSSSFKQLPNLIKNIILGKKVLLKNNGTGEYMYANQSLACKGVWSPTCGQPKVIMGIPGNKSDSRFHWTFKPIMDKWDNNDNDNELFYIENLFEKYILHLGDDRDGSLDVIHSDYDDLPISERVMFYVQLYDETHIIIQWSYEGLRTLHLKNEDAWKIPKLIESKLRDGVESSIWIVEQAM